MASLEDMSNLLLNNLKLSGLAHELEKRSSVAVAQVASSNYDAFTTQRSTISSLQGVVDFFDHQELLLWVHRCTGILFGTQNSHALI